MDLLEECHTKQTPASIKAAHFDAVKLPLEAENTVNEKIRGNNRGLCAKMTRLVPGPYSALDKDQHSSTLQM